MLLDMKPSSLLPALLLHRLAAVGPVFSGAFNLNLFGWRCPDGKVDRFDDVIGAVYQDDGGTWQVQTWPATTDPGLTYLREPMRERGTAILVPGRYAQCWTIGLHRGRYEALVQRAPMSFWRDANRDATLDQRGPVETSVIGCNLHNASASPDAQVGAASAGCQVIRDAKDFTAMMDLARRQKGRWGDRFSYTLLGEL